VISAPSDDFDGDPAITTTTLTTDGNYTNLFGGTSSAAPLASGVIALILEANPALGWRDVQEILIRSARRVDSSSPDWSNNGAGFHFHHGYGAGMIDAAAAITIAKTWTNLTNRKQQQFNSPSIDLAIPDENQTGITHTFEVTGEELRVEHVILTVDIDHSYRGDLKIILISPDGTQSILATTSDSPEKGYDNYPLLSVRHWGESSSGNWTLQVIDNFASDAGTLRKATLTLHGTQPRGYRSWVEENFTQEESSNDVISGELADPDLDGRNNLLEYAFAGDPKKSEATLPGEPKIIKSDGQSKVRFTRDLAKSDIQYSLTRSSNLVDSWLKISTTTAITNGTFEICELILDSSQKQFFRIKISK
jgi:subtilisin-like proprotein convertase family protein